MLKLRRELRVGLWLLAVLDGIFEEAFPWTIR